jgi:hypothetical protein
MVLAFAFTFLPMVNSINSVIFINEVMPDPDDGCRDCTEWVELYLDNNSIDFIIDVGGRNNSLSINCSGFFIITENKTSFLHLWYLNETAVLEGGMSLNNDGDCVVIYNDTLIIDSFCYNSSKKNVSWVRCETGWEEREIATPGYENGCSVYDDGIGALSIIYWEIVPTKATIGDSVNFSLIIENKGSEPINVSTFIIVEQLGKEIFCGELELANVITTTTNCTWVITGDLITDGEEKFEVYPEIEFNGSRKQGRIDIITLKGTQDFGSPYIIAEDVLDSVRFGDFAQVITNMYTGNNKLPLRIVAYVYKPKWVSMDLDGNTIHSHLNNTGTALLIENVSMGKNVTLSIPLFIKSNCVGEYSDGVYRGRIRAYLGFRDEIVMEDSFNIVLVGNNPMFCVECPKCEKTGCNCNVYSSIPISGGLKNRIQNESHNLEEQLIEVVSYEKYVQAGNIFKTVVKIGNIFNVTQNFSVYSYVFNGSECISLGFDGKSWKKTWTANKKSMEIPSNSSFNLTLENMIGNGTGPGIHKFRIRVNYGDKTKDITRGINITLPLEETSTIVAQHEANFTESFELVSKGSVIGMTTGENPDIFFLFLRFYNNINSLLFSIFKF